MEALVNTFNQAWSEEDGKLLASTVSLSNPDLLRFANSTNAARVQDDIRHELYYDNTAKNRIKGSIIDSWVTIYTSYWKIAVALEKSHNVDWNEVFEAMKDMTQAVIRGFQNTEWPVWCLDVLYVSCKYLRYVAVRADEGKARHGEISWTKLEEAARIINRAFNVCLNDRAALQESRKWGTYNIINLLFKTYFKLDAITLSKNILRALNANKTDMPDLLDFKTSDVVTFKYYCGVIAFLDEDYFNAETNLEMAYKLCHKDAIKNRELILTYLIPTKLLTHNQLPSPSLLKPYPFLEDLFLPLSKCIKAGNLRDYDKELAKAEDWFVKKRIFLTLERGRDITLRNLFRKVYLAAGESRTRIPVEHFKAAVSMMSGIDMEIEEVECFIANAIYKGFMKGYISRERGMVVLSGTQAFPGTGV